MLFFTDSSRLLILSLGSFFCTFLFCAMDGSSRAASPQGCLLGGQGAAASSCCKTQALSLANSTNLCSWLWFTFLLMLRDVSKGFWMCRGEESGLFCSRPYRSRHGRERSMNTGRAQTSKAHRTPALTLQGKGCLPWALGMYACEWVGTGVLCLRPAAVLWDSLGKTDATVQVTDTWTTSTIRIIFKYINFT